MLQTKAPTTALWALPFGCADFGYFWGLSHSIGNWMVSGHHGSAWRKEVMTMHIAGFRFFPHEHKKKGVQSRIEEHVLLFSRDVYEQ